MKAATEVKICGLTNLDDARAALDCGADCLGFVLYARSPRSVSPARLADIRARLDPACRVIGVFVNEAPSWVEKVAGDCGLYRVQIHGAEDAGAFKALKIPLWRALRVTSAGCEPEPGDWSAERYVVDAAPAGVYGGAGTVAEWGLAAELASRYNIMLAGGLTPENVAEAVRTVHPFGVDVSSGVEREPGFKDHRKMRDFIKAVKG